MPDTGSNLTHPHGEGRRNLTIAQIWAREFSGKNRHLVRVGFLFCMYKIYLEKLEAIDDQPEIPGGWYSGNPDCESNDLLYRRTTDKSKAHVFTSYHDALHFCLSASRNGYPLRCEPRITLIF